MEAKAVQSIKWVEDHAEIIDQTLLPEKEKIKQITSTESMWEAIHQLRIRGAPAIGIAAGYGLYLGIKAISVSTFDSFIKEVNEVADFLKSSRPTAVNLEWALRFIINDLYKHKDKPIDDLKQRVLNLAKKIHHEDRRTCRQIGEHGKELIEDNDRILTHCNTGGLATAQYGTAFSIIYHASLCRNSLHVWVNETRPLLQGSRLTAWELQNAGIPFQIIVDSAAAFLMAQNKVNLVIVGADRITANGDTANKIGTYNLAVLARHHHIPFYVAAPCSTIDINLKSGKEVPIEERDRSEVTQIAGRDVSPSGAKACNLAFDITPHHLITGIITEYGIMRGDYKNAILQMTNKSSTSLSSMAT